MLAWLIRKGVCLHYHLSRVRTSAGIALFLGVYFFNFNLLLFLICFFNLLIDLFFLVYLKGLCHGLLFLHKSRSPRTPLITLRVNSFFYCFSSMFPPFIVIGRACMTISRSTDDNNVFCMSSQKDDSR